MCEAALTGIPPGDHRRGSMSDSTTRTIRATAPALSARYAAVAHRWPYLATEHVVDVLDLAESKRTIDLIAESPFVGGYHRSDEDMAAMEQRVLGYVPREVLGESQLAMVVLDGLHPLVDWSRTREIGLDWSEMPAYMHGYEHAARFFAFCDFGLQQGPRIVFAGRMFDGRKMGPESTGSQVVDALLGQITPEEVCSFHGIDDLHKVWESSSMYRIKDIPRNDRYPFGYGAFAYLGVIRMAIEDDVSAILSYVNEATARQLVRQGIPSVPLGGRELKPRSDEGSAYFEDCAAYGYPLMEAADSMLNANAESSEFLDLFRKPALPRVVVRAAG